MEQCWQKVSIPRSHIIVGFTPVPPLPQQYHHQDPAERPDFNVINDRLDTILVEAAISDEAGQRFWLENFRKEVSFLVTISISLKLFLFILTKITAFCAMGQVL